MDPTEKVRENRIRRMAERQGLMLEKSRRRDTRAFDYGKYRLVSAETNAVIMGASPASFSANLDEVEDWLTG